MYIMYYILYFIYYILYLKTYYNRHFGFLIARFGIFGIVQANSVVLIVVLVGQVSIFPLRKLFDGNRLQSRKCCVISESFVAR